MTAKKTTRPDSKFGSYTSDQYFVLRMSRDQIALFFELVEKADYNEVAGEVDELFEMGLFVEADDQPIGKEGVVWLTPAGSALRDLLEAAGYGREA